MMTVVMVKVIPSSFTSSKSRRSARSRVEFFPYFCRKCFFSVQMFRVSMTLNNSSRFRPTLRRRIQLSGEPFEVLGSDDAVISHERQIDFFVKVDKLSRRMCDGVDVSTGFRASRAEVF